MLKKIIINFEILSDGLYMKIKFKKAAKNRAFKALFYLNLKLCKIKFNRKNSIEAKVLLRPQEYNSDHTMKDFQVVTVSNSTDLKQLFTLLNLSRAARLFSRLYLC